METDEYLDGAPDPEEKTRQFKAELFARLDNFGQELAKTRSDAIEGRKASGIEEIWTEDEEYYEGIDDANRHERNGGRSSKPTSASGGGPDDTAVGPTGSTVFPNITKSYVDAAAARVADMLLPTDDVSWEIAPTPIPEMVAAAKGEFTPEVNAQMAATIKDPAALQAKQQELAASIAKTIAEARQKAEDTTKRIRDWHTECQYITHARTQIEDSSRMGTGVLRGPVAVNRKKTAYMDGQIVIKSDIQPASECVSAWNCFPDPACGEDIQDGSFHWERDDITPAKLQRLMEDPGYIREQIEACLVEGPHEACSMVEGQEMAGLQKRDQTKLFEIWYGYCMAKREDYVAALNANADPVETENGDLGLQYSEEKYPEYIHVYVVMVNNRVIRITENILETGEFPYDYFVWQRRKNSPWGIGVSRQVRVAQDIMKAGFRNMMDNGGMASGPQVIINTKYVQPMNGVYEITGWKFWDLVQDLEGTLDIDKVFRFIKVDMFQAEMAAIIEMALRHAEDSTGFPMIMQGQTSSSTPDTLGGMQIQNDNASTVLRRIARLHDDLVTERHIRRYHTFHLQYGPDEEKGDFSISAMGSSAMVERAIQAQQMPFILQMANNPVYGLDPKKVGAEQIKAMRFDIRRFEYDDEQWKGIVENLAAQSQKGNDSVTVAQIREEGATQRKNAELASRENTIAYQEEQESMRLQMKQQFESGMALAMQDVTAFIEQNKGKINEEQIKAKLAEATAKIKAMYDLSPLKGIKPPAEPPGRAPNGQAYSQ